MVENDGNMQVGDYYWYSFSFCSMLVWYHQEMQLANNKIDHVTNFNLQLFAQNICIFHFSWLGFNSGGIGKDTVASWVQSYFYGGTIPKGSMFSRFQSWGATGKFKTLASYLKKTWVCWQFSMWWGQWFLIL